MRFQFQTKIKNLLQHLDYFYHCQPNFARLSTTLQILQTLAIYSVGALQVADFSNLYPPIRILGG